MALFVFLIFLIFKFFIFDASLFACHAVVFYLHVIKKKLITPKIKKKTEPLAVASTIGQNVLENSFDVRYTPGTRTSEMAIIL